MDTTSNSKNMSLEDKLVQDLKDNRLGALIGDEDALAKLAKRAIDEALFKDRYRQEGSGFSSKTITEPSLVVETAKEVCEKAIKSIMDEVTKSILDNPETMKAITEATASLFPSIILRHLDIQAMHLHQNIQREAVMKLTNAFNSINQPAVASAILNVHNSMQGPNDSKMHGISNNV